MHGKQKTRNQKRNKKEEVKEEIPEVFTKELKEELVNDFNAYCGEMEGGAIAHVCTLNKVPFVILRTISDKADDSATMDYPAFEKLAIANNVKVMKELVANI